MKCNFRLALFLWGLSLSVLAQGYNLEDQKALMEAQIEMLKKQTDLSAALKTWAQAGSMSLPRVITIGIRGQEAFTKLLFSNASEMIFKSGESIKRGLTVAKIDEGGVWVDLELSRGLMKRIRLDFAQLPVNETWMAGELLGAAPNVMPLVDWARVQSSSVLMPLGSPLNKARSEKELHEARESTLGALPSLSASPEGHEQKSIQNMAQNNAQSNVQINAHGIKNDSSPITPQSPLKEPTSAKSSGATQPEWMSRRAR